MKALFDIGNTFCKYALATGESISDIKIIESNDIETSWLSETFGNIDECIISNVNNHEITQKIKDWCDAHTTSCFVIESEAEKFGVQCAYDTPENFGVDRWVALLGARKKFPNQHVLIIDLGTATTIDLLLKNGQHIGGWILPGLNTLMTSLLRDTTHINAEKSTLTRLELAKTTSLAVNHGVHAATVGAIEHGINIMFERYLSSNDDYIIVLTGGNAEAIAPLIKHETIVFPKLLLTGMNLFNATNLK